MVKESCKSLKNQILISCTTLPLFFPSLKPRFFDFMEQNYGQAFVCNTVSPETMLKTANPRKQCPPASPGPPTPDSRFWTEFF
jgi:hypothetical protein